MVLFDVCSKAVVLLLLINCLLLLKLFVGVTCLALVDCPFKFARWRRDMVGGFNLVVFWCHVI